jgi:hypothetical protein
VIGDEQDVVEGQRLGDHSHAWPAPQSGIIRTAASAVKPPLARRRRLTEPGKRFTVVFRPYEDNVMTTPARLVLTLAAAALAALPAAAQQLYKYVGPDGKVQYSDRPPADGRKAEKVTSSRISSVGPGAGGASAAAASGDGAKPSAPKTAAEQEQAFRQRRIDAEEKAKKDEKLALDQQQKAESCAGARRELAGLQSGQRIARLNEQGERIFLDDAGVQSEIARLQREVAAGCK